MPQIGDLPAASPLAASDYVAVQPVTGVTKRASVDQIPGAISDGAIAQVKVNGLVSGLAAKVATTEKGAANGVAQLDANGFVPAAQTRPGFTVYNVKDPAYGAVGTGIPDDTAAINAAIAAANTAGGGIVYVPAGTYRTTNKINMVDVNNVALVGAGRATNLARSGTTNASAIIEVSGYNNSVSDLILNGVDKTPATGLYVKGYPQPSVTASTRNLEVARVRVTQCKEGLRLGHYSTLNGVTGDTVDPDIPTNLFDTLWLENCDYGIVLDGQNILENQWRNLLTSTITYHHVYLPRGGYFDVDNWDAMATTTAGYAKVETAAGDVCIRRCRSENNAGIIVPLVHTSNGGTRVVVADSELTNITAPTTQTDLNFAGGHVVLSNVDCTGKIALSNTDLVALSVSAAGGYVRTGNQYTKRELVIDNAVGTIQTTQLTVQSDNAGACGVNHIRDGVSAGSFIAVANAKDRVTHDPTAPVLANPWVALAARVASVTATDQSSVLSLANYQAGGYRAVGLGCTNAIPTTGTWAAGDVLLNTAPAAGGFIGWVCVAAGTPGTWKTFGVISA